jgi:LacI family transcriptional regulator
MRSIPHVALLIETSGAYGRGLLFGVMRYLREHGPWSVYLHPHDLGAPPPPWLRKWRGDGVLVRNDDRRIGRAIRARGLPAVDLRSSESGLPYIGFDNRIAVRLAFEHLLDSGLKQFGFCGLPRNHDPGLDLRCDLFQELVVAKGYNCHVFDRRAKSRDGWEEEQDHLVAWLLELPRPIGVMAYDDDRGEQVLDACRRADILVPDEVAVIGVDNDEILCNLSSPPLSSVDVDAPRMGYEAAALLGRLMTGKRPPRRPLLLPPRGVVCRESTDLLATADRELASAIRFLREHACEGLRLKEFLRETQLSRRALERRMRKLLGRSPKEELMRVQFIRAKQLLAETDLPAAAIAAKCGFGQPSYFSRAFRAKVGVSPRDYRSAMNLPKS